MLDADFFYYEKLQEVLERLNSIPGARVILTPHPKELHELLLRTSVVCFALFESTRSTTGMNAAVVSTSSTNGMTPPVIEINDAVIEPAVPELCQRVEITGRTRDSEITFAEVCTHRFEYARKFAEKFPNLVLVSKGANTYICSGKNCFICDRGTSALAKAGSGDVLAGLCTALLAQGYAPLEAAKTAVFAHAEAARSFERNYECTPLGLVERFGKM